MPDATIHIYLRERSLNFENTTDWERETWPKFRTSPTWVSQGLRLYLSPLSNNLHTKERVMSAAKSTGLPRQGKGKAISLEPGIYVAARALAMGFPNNLGAHQFVLSIPKAACFGEQQKLEDHQVIVIGAYQISGRLQPGINSPSDVNATHQYLKGTGKLDVARVNWSQVDSGIGSLLQGYQRYIKYEKGHEIKYPEKGGFSFLGCKSDGTYNSNSWAQSLIHHRLGPNLVKSDFSGIDICNATRIPADYFK